MKKFRNFLEYIIFLFVYYLNYFLPYKIASGLMGNIFAFIGPMLPVTKIAYKNLQFAFPHMSYQQKKIIIKKMWENLGRIVGEFPHTAILSKTEIDDITTIHNAKILLDLKNSGEGAVLLTAHFGNWENSLRKVKSLGVDMAVVYRQINNKFIDNFIKKARGRVGVEQIPKTTTGVKQIFTAIAKKKFVCILADQKQNTGIETDFFSKKVMTGTLPAKLAFKKNIKLIPVMSVRDFKRPSHYDLYIDTPIEVESNDNIATITQKINNIYQHWITKYPEQWFWVHKRCPKEEYKTD